mmetsp:Transcript_8082/g.18764  ORF Transcript_8082/g.18764 Transcript_8082/m.18764 type:complete len:93 (+) Transcript_8082:484-762(+)
MNKRRSTEEKLCCPLKGRDHPLGALHTNSKPSLVLRTAAQSPSAEFAGDESRETDDVSSPHYFNISDFPAGKTALSLDVCTTIQKKNYLRDT